MASEATFKSLFKYPVPPGRLHYSAPAVRLLTYLGFVISALGALGVPLLSRTVMQHEPLPRGLILLISTCPSGALALAAVVCLRRVTGELPGKIKDALQGHLRSIRVVRWLAASKIRKTAAEVVFNATLAIGAVMLWAVLSILVYYLVTALLWSWVIGN